MNIEYKSDAELEAAGYKFHHSAWCRGYCSRKDHSFSAVPYKGRFGEGFVVYSPSWESTRYRRIAYYLKAGEVEA